MTTRTTARELETRLNEIVKRYRPTHRITSVKRKDFFSLNEAIAYCEKYHIDTNKIYEIN